MKPYYAIIDAAQKVLGVSTRYTKFVHASNARACWRKAERAAAQLFADFCTDREAVALFIDVRYPDGVWHAQEFFCAEGDGELCPVLR